MSVRRWLRAVGESAPPPVPDDGCPIVDWAASGAMALTGHGDGPPVVTPGSMWSLLRETGSALTWLSARIGTPVDPDPALLLTGRAGARNLTRRGRTSAGGATRLLRASDGWCALTLSRPDDLELVPAILGRSEVPDPWVALTMAVRDTEADQFAAHVRQFGLPVAALPPEPAPAEAPWRVTRIAPPVPGLRLDHSLVVDLSSLWAGPLCAHLLGRAGARIVKVESTRRPDGARSGSRSFYDWLHAGHESVAVDFTTGEGRAALAELVRAADVVIEASRPRALGQLGLAPERLGHRAGKVWVSITGYGRGHAERVAFGDDAAVAGGLVGRSGGEPVFCADAVADPLTGLVAATGVMGSVAGGGGQLIDVSMRDVAAGFAGVGPVGHGPHTVSAGEVECPALGRTAPVRPPRIPEPSGRAPVMGVDTRRVLAEVAVTRGRRTRPAPR
ncbi:CoA transferase [Streptomyces cylindrosporus]|uniref:CoA transferase n=1 Tax=Streptomyces cylindrosporus TaxID=2927583 RepID=UPI0027E2EA24|nr:CoA transferase [Streptomyces cylindrosporus]